MKTQKISPEFLERLNESSKRNEALNTELIVLSKLEFELNKRKVQAEHYYSECVKADNQIAEDIELEYGKIRINLTTGEYEIQE